MQALLVSLTEAERALVRQTERDQMAGLDEDELMALLVRVRRARDKYTTLYRRQSASRVTRSGGRGKAFGKGTMDRGKAEVFEDALARVSRRLAAAARTTAQELKAERIAETRAGRDTATPAVKRAKEPLPAAQRATRRPRSPNRVKRHAATRAAGARRQSQKDSRVS